MIIGGVVPDCDPRLWRVCAGSIHPDVRVRGHV